MTAQKRSVAIRVKFSIFLVLAVVFFLCTIGLGTYAIINAGLVAACVDNDPRTFCQGAFNRTEYNYWLAGAAGAAGLKSLFATLMFCAVVEMTKEKESLKPIHIPRELKELGKRGNSEIDLLHSEPADEGEARTVAGSGPKPEGAVRRRGGVTSGGLAISEVGDNVDGAVKVTTDVIGGEEVKEWQETTVRSFTPLAGIVLFFGILVAMCALLCSIIMPLLLFISTGLIAVVLDFITIGQMDMRVMICYILPAVSLKEGKKNNYWAILDTYYLPLSKRLERSKHGFLYSCDKNRYTWYFAIICALSMLLVFSYFVNQTITDQKNFGECPSDLSFVCFRERTFAYVNCSRGGDSNITLLHCYKFLRFGVDVSIVTALSQSFAFYLLIVTFSHQILFLLRFLLTIHPSRFWGCGLFVFCALLIAGAIAVLVKSDVFIAYTDILSILEFFMVGGIVFIFGLMIVEGKWWEKVPFYVPRQVHFVQYGITTHRQLKEVEHIAALETNGGKEILHKEIAAV
eukprot:Em0012g957a